jgi:hypothetical protein
MAKKIAPSKDVVPFTPEGIRTFNKLQAAVVYFAKGQKIPEASVVKLYNETYSYSVGKTSVNLAKYYVRGVFDDKAFVEFLGKRNVIRNERQRDLILAKVNVLIQSWQPVPVVKASEVALPTEPTV